MAKSPSTSSKSSKKTGGNRIKGAGKRRKDGKFKKR